MKLQKILFILFSLFFAVFAFADGLQNEQSEQSADVKQTFTIVATSHNYDLNPHTASYSAEAQLLSAIYEGLFSYDPVTLEPLFALAKDYKISRDKKRWTFILRDDIFFSDGKPIFASDVRNSWIALLKEKNAPYSSLFDIIKGAKSFRMGGGDGADDDEKDEEVGIFVLDNKTISIYLEKPASHFPRLLCMPSFAVKSENKNVYSGAFILKSIDEKNCVLEKNEYYYDVKNVKLDEIDFVFSSDENENAFLFNTGLTDWVVAPVNLSKMIVKDAAHIMAEFSTEYLFFKLQDNVWKNQSLRAALLEAVPWKKLRENTFVPAETLVYPLNGYKEPNGFSDSDEAEAILMMKQAKKDLNISGELTIKMAVTEGDRLKKEAELLNDAWKPLGVTLETVEIPSRDYLFAIPKTSADIFSYTWIGDFADPLAFLELFRSSSTLNVTDWKNSEYDKLLDEASLYTAEKRYELLSNAEQILLDDAIILPIQHPVSLNIIDLNYVGGWAVNAFDIHPLKYIFKKQDDGFDVPNVVFRNSH